MHLMVFSECEQEDVMPQSCFIGIDQGSSSTKALALSMDGQVLFRTKKALAPAFRDGLRVEQDPLAILASVREVLDETIPYLRSAGVMITGIGLACQRSSCLAWEELTGKPLSPVLSWRDTRGADYVQSISASSQRIFDITGLPLTPYYAASKFRWLKDHMQESRGPGAVFGTLSSFLCQRLTNADRAFIDHTNAARTQLMNIHSCAWDQELLALFGLTDIRLPAITPTLHNFGTIRSGAEKIPLLACIGDQQAAMAGLGILEKNDGGINYGTGGFLMVNTGNSLVPAAGLMASIHYSTDQTRHYLVEGSVNAVGDSLEWLREQLHVFKEYAELDDLCWQAATDVVAFIGLNGTGSPHWERNISSSIHGLTAASKSCDIVRSAVESIAFFMKDIATAAGKSGLEPVSFAVSGGLASLSYLVQIQSDILGRDLRISAEQEVSALGAALLAGLSLGVWSSKDIKKLVPQVEEVQARHNAGAEKRYRRWKELHRMTKQLDEM
jgi:glycerol kinase